MCFADVQADMIDLTTAGATDTINGALFQQVDAASTGTGLIQSFVRIQANGEEAGYNTDYRGVEFDELTSATFTHSLSLSDVPIVELGGISYREFLLDINENNGGDNELLSLDVLEIYTASTGSLTDYAGGWGTPDYEMGAGNSILLDYSLNTGSGSGDMYAYIPDSLFTGGPYVYLYSKFSGADAGPEEWAVRMVAVVPAPAAVFLGILGLGVAGLKLRKFA
jgi:hypothetical protein